MLRQPLRLSLCGFSVFVALLFIVTGCAHPLEKKLEGRWFGESVDGFEDADIAVATGWARGTSFEFGSGALTVTIPTDEPRRGKYEIRSAHQGDVTLSVVRETEEPETVRLTLEDTHLMRWLVDDERSVLLRREP